MKFTHWALLAVPALLINTPAAAGNAAAGKGPEATFNAVCAACHASGAMNAPKVGDKKAWAPRFAKGQDTLIKHAINGINMMPPKGGATNLSDAEVAQTVVYMANKSGAKFKAPK
ncbi:MAG TPA: c-type cytochrome [Methylophilaceae bacterium]|nr:c-type cytochrome [Methylophilaceae bacterium]